MSLDLNLNFMIIQPLLKFFYRYDAESQSFMSFEFLVLPSLLAKRSNLKSIFYFSFEIASDYRPRADAIGQHPAHLSSGQ